jgi:hypothetical protein
MRYLVGFICVLALGVMGCSETVGTDLSAGVSGEVAAEWCYRFCVMLECNYDHTPEECQDSCKRRLAGACGGYLAVYEECVDDCNDLTTNCGPHAEAMRECLRGLGEDCEACPEGTLLGDCLAESAYCNTGWCVDTGGDCNATYHDKLCSIEVTAGLCDVGYETCVAQEGDCSDRSE